jgi:ABC-type transporter MlaC component
LFGESKKKIIKYPDMKKISTTLVLLFICFLPLSMVAWQDSAQSEIARLIQEKEQVINNEKAALKQEIEGINKRFDEKLISGEQAEKEKEEAATRRAMNIKNKVTMIEDQMGWLWREQETEEES